MARRVPRVGFPAPAPARARRSRAPWSARPLVASEIAMNRRIVSAAPVFARLVLIGGRLHGYGSSLVHAMNDCCHTVNKLLRPSAPACVPDCQQGLYRATSQLPKWQLSGRAAALETGERSEDWGKAKFLRTARIAILTIHKLLDTTFGKTWTFAANAHKMRTARGLDHLGPPSP